MIRNFSGRGVYIYDTSGTSVLDSTVTNTGTDGTNAGHAISAFWDVAGRYNVLIERNHIDTTSTASSGAEGIKFVISGNVPGVTLQSVWQVGNDIAVGYSASNGGMCIEDWQARADDVFTDFHVIGNRCKGSGGVQRQLGHLNGWRQRRRAADERSIRE
jgi:hypothetical protein